MPSKNENARLIFELLRRYNLKSRFVGKAYATDVTTTESHLLIELDAHPGKNISELCEALSLDRSTLSRSLDSLARRGVLSPKRLEEDRRNKNFSLTSKGKIVLAKLDESSNKHIQNFVDNLGPEEMAKLTRFVL